MSSFIPTEQANHASSEAHPPGRVNQQAPARHLRFGDSVVRDELDARSVFIAERGRLPVGRRASKPIPKRTLDVVDELGATILDFRFDKPFLVPQQRGHSFTLPFGYRLARRRTFNNRWTVLPSTVADMLCCNVQPVWLLKVLNTIFDTQYCLDDSLQAILSGFIDEGSDLGQTYGHLRSDWMDGEFKRLQSAMRERQKEDEEMRNSAITGDIVTNPCIPPRRVWDLYSNRVLPSYVLKDRNGHYRSIHPVSHSWRPPDALRAVLTTINGKEWRVPIPRDTTLDAVRNELLILGAEYVWLDVLCLRQHDKLLPGREIIRKTEWRLDIPTIGGVYQDPRKPVIIYFNGLGRPFSDGEVDPTDKYHWMHRIWTMQELTDRIKIGGFRHKLDAINILDPASWPLEINHDFLTLLKSQPMQSQRLVRPRLEEICENLRTRSYSNRVDQVAVLSYFLLKRVPCYNPDISTDLAWRMVLENMDDMKRTQLLFTDFGPRKQPGPWTPTWEEFISCRRFADFPHIGDPYLLRFLSSSQLSVGGRGELPVGAYWHVPYVIEEARIHIPQSGSHSNGEAIGRAEVPFARGLESAWFEIYRWGESIEKDAPYILISVGHLRHWLVGREKGVRMIDGRRALEVEKVSTMTALRLDRDLEAVVQCRKRCVVYR